LWYRQWQGRDYYSRERFFPLLEFS
jgi:hypothetical protein